MKAKHLDSMNFAIFILLLGAQRCAGLRLDADLQESSVEKTRKELMTNATTALLASFLQSNSTKSTKVWDSFVDSVKKLDPNVQKALLKTTDKTSGQNTKATAKKTKGITDVDMTDANALFDKIVQLYQSAAVKAGIDAELDNDGDGPKVKSSFGVRFQLAQQAAGCNHKVSMLKSYASPTMSHSPSLSDDMLVTIGMMAMKTPVLQALWPGIVADLATKCTLLANLFQLEGGQDTKFHFNHMFENIFKLYKNSAGFAATMGTIGDKIANMVNITDDT